MSAIQVLAIRKLDGKSTVKAFVDIQIGGVTLKGCKIVQQDGQSAWLAMPSVKGNHGWTNTVELSKPLRDRVNEAVLAAWATHQPAERPAAQAERGRQTAEALDERGASWSKRQRDAHVQELAAQFDERGPDEIPF